MNEKRLLIFAGAGASFGVDGNQFPTTVGFRKLLPTSITDNYLFQQVENYLETIKKEEPPYDIEKILWELGEFEKNLEKINDQNSLTAHLFKTGSLGPLGFTQSSQQIQSQFAQTADHVRKLQTEIYDLVYRLYANQPDISKLNSNWLPLLRWAKDKYDVVDIVTTNYDLVIETALLEVPLVDTARQNPFLPVLNEERWKEYETPAIKSGLNLERKGLLTKLHGSVDWAYAMHEKQSGKPRIRVGNPDPHGGHETRAIIYPGFKGTPAKEPFALFHRYLKGIWRDCSHAIFIGFAFRDEYLNMIFEIERDKQRPVAIIDPAPRKREDYPSFREVSFISKGFGEAQLEEKLDRWFNSFK